MTGMLSDRNLTDEINSFTGAFEKPLCRKGWPYPRHKHTVQSTCWWTHEHHVAVEVLKPDPELSLKTVAHNPR